MHFRSLGWDIGGYEGLKAPRYPDTARSPATNKGRVISERRSPPFRDRLIVSLRAWLYSFPILAWFRYIKLYFHAPNQTLSAEHVVST